MIHAYKYRLYPTEEQVNALEDTLDICRQLYNKLLSQLKSESVVPTKTELSSRVTGMKNDWDELRNVHSRVLLMVARRLHSNITNISANPNDLEPERLRYKGSGWYKSFTYHQSGFELNVGDEWLDSLYLSKIGNVPIRYHREIPANAGVKQVSIKRDADGCWFAVFGVETEDSDAPDPEFIDTQVYDTVFIGAGIDSFSVDTDGTAVELPDVSDLDKKLNRRKKDLQRKQKESSNYQRSKDDYWRIVKKKDRKYNDFLHKLSRYYVENYECIIVEYRYVGEDDRSLWNDFVNLLEYKAESASALVKTKSEDESKSCEDCGITASKKHWICSKGCPSCGSSGDRDLQPEIERVTPDHIGMGRSEVKPVDIIATVEDLESFAGGMDESGSSPPLES